ncbi:Rhomboid protease gluP [Monoraphidium neglectum]|uniref:Rhomboid protease gluP n=1 Tax=Monoraphidium neglectum TaxID=145388 RepID=A0A0D2NB77_9CHLO|nr:Rhomboid protease gluP [Monoraphidium neglectum]KIZ02741.1 Rhomboid protease gluP [Monoraphidium neglectum]|eukprot:XP_013901760.1 Rhomboid protease gluP [Monoraphidium neglectum]
MALNGGMYLLQQAYPGLVLKLARVNHLVSQGEVWRLLTPALVHANLFHLAINTLSLYMIGPSVEAILGRTRFAAVYAASAVTGNALSWWMGSTGFSMAVGASSSISGLFGAYGAALLRGCFVHLRRLCSALAAPRAGELRDEGGGWGGGLGGGAPSALCDEMMACEAALFESSQELLELIGVS